jgi:hypothetical protein
VLEKMNPSDLMSTLFEAQGRRDAPMSSSHPVRDGGLRDRRGKECQTRGGRGEGGARRDHFTIEDHLRVQAQIEKRAHQLWRESAIGQNDPLTNWLRAEGEVLREFCLARRQFGAISV